MFKTNRNKLIVLVCMGVVTTFGITAYTPDKPQEGYKNLQVLPKDISKDSLDKIMHGFNAALGVKCNFCHAFKDGHPDFPSDDKPEKDVARYMLHMTSEINKNFFNMNNSTQPDTLSVVKCVTCHHGNPHPNEAAMASNVPPPPPPAPGADSTNKMSPQRPPNQQ